MTQSSNNVLYYGDNLDVLRRHVKDESVDLVYLDPPFNSNANYNVLFAEKDGTKAASQIRAFSDTWTWTQESESAYAEIVTAGGRVADCLRAFRTFLGECDMLAYLVMMAPRLIELRRVMKTTASIYLHCDPTASHYLKILLDAVFGPGNFRNEIIWERTTGRKSERQFGRVHDVILFYSRSHDWTWNPQITPQDESNVFGHDLLREKGIIYRLSDLSGAGSGPPRRFGARGEMSPPTGRHWQYEQDGIDRLLAEGRIFFSRGGKPRLKTRIDDLPGKSVRDIWADIGPINAAATERLGYPTQKPQSLLERIISASSNPGDTVLDPFCGCGTTIAAAQALNRPWIGIDITHLAINLIKNRLKDSFADATFIVIGEPISVPDADQLAQSDPYQFQWWVLGLVGARPVEQKKGADKGIDGRIIFQGDKLGSFESVILSVKAGHTSAPHVRDLKGVLAREQAAIGVLISMQEPTAPMRIEAATAGFYESATWGRKYPKVQLLTVAELLAGKKVEMPPIRQVGATFKKAPKPTKQQAEQQKLI